LGAGQRDLFLQTAVESAMQPRLLVAIVRVDQVIICFCNFNQKPEASRASRRSPRRGIGEIHNRCGGAAKRGEMRPSLWLVF